MKKFVAIICVVAMLMSFTTTAFADEWDILSPQYKKCEAVSEFSIVLNKPLECLAFLNEEAGFDIKYMIEELTKAKYTAKIQAETSDDALKAKIAMAVNADVPVCLSEDLKFGADVTLYMWMEYDFTSVENAKYNIIIKNPLNGQYLTLDYFELMAETGVDMKSALVETYKGIDVNAGTEELTTLVKNVYKKHAKLDVNGNEYTVTLTNDAMVDMVFDLILGYLETDYVKSLGADTSMLDTGYVDMATIQALVKGLGIFGENDACVMKAETNALGQVVETEESVHIDFNIVELAAALGAAEDELYPLTKENSNIDLTFKSKTSYTKINEDNVAQFPVLTEENSAKLMDVLAVIDLGGPIPENFDNKTTYQPEYFWNSAKGMMERNGMYVDANGFIESCNWDEDNLTGKAAVGEDGAVVIILTSDNFGTVVVKGNLKEDAYTLNDTQLWGRKPFKVATEYNWESYEGEEVLYVSMDVLNYILGAKVQSIQTYILDENLKEMTNPEYYFETVRPNPAYVAPSEQ